MRDKNAVTRTLQIIAHELGDLGFVVDNEDGFHSPGMSLRGQQPEALPPFNEEIASQRALATTCNTIIRPYSFFSSGCSASRCARLCHSSNIGGKPPSAQFLGHRPGPPCRPPPPRGAR